MDVDLEKGEECNMSRYRGPNCKICQRNKTKLFLKGEKCDSAKCVFEKKQDNRKFSGRRLSEYGVRLREKQKLRFYYGVTETQMRNSFSKAVTAKGVTGYILLLLFERRLDNIIYRAGLAPSRYAARQLVCHGHAKVDDRKVDIPSQVLKIGSVVSLKEVTSKRLKPILDKIAQDTLPSWLSFEKDKGIIKVVSYPKREEIDTPVDEQLIVEYYSR
jgi:small subunit ribosomal protein S4